MIEQPELGKKIADLRKAKGLTQEELVEKCNLNVRTLQRIESGEATPRTYTLRLIFEALEYSFDKSKEDKGLTQMWLEQFYISFIDLFNLKTNTMKKISILSIMFSTIAFGLFAIVTESKAQVKTDKTVQIIEKQEDISPSKETMSEGYFSCESSFYDNDELIGYNAKFKKDGVSVSVQLLKLNTSTGEFNAGFVKGIFLNHKVEASVPKEWIAKKVLNFEAEDSIVYLDDKIRLYGKAKLFSSKNELIEANKIVIFYEEE